MHVLFIIGYIAALIIIFMRLIGTEKVILGGFVYDMCEGLIVTDLVGGAVLTSRSKFVNEMFEEKT